MITNEMMDEWRKKTETIALAELKRLIVLNDWEAQFIPSIREQLRDNKPLTMQQSICLNKIYRRIK